MSVAYETNSIRHAKGGKGMSNTKKSVMSMVHVIIVFLLMFGFKYIPAVPPITQYGMAILGVFFGLVWGWSFCSLAWPSLVAMVALGLTEYGITQTVLSNAFAQANLLVLLFSFLILAPVTQSGLGEWLALKVITMKAIEGKPYRLLFAVMVATFVLSIFVNAIVIGIFLMSIFVPMFKKMGYEKGDAFIPMFLAGIFINTGLASLLLPVRGMPLFVFGTMAAQGLVVNNAQYLTFAVVGIPIVIVWYLACFKIFRINVKPLEKANFSEYKARLQQPLTKQQKTLAVLVFFMVLCEAFVGIVGSANGSPFAQLLNKVGIYGVILMTLAVMLIIHIDGKPLVDLTEAAKGVQWQLIFLYAMAMLISGILTDQSTGISSFILAKTTPILMRLGQYWFLLLLAGITLVLTNIGNNVVVIFTMCSVVMMMVKNGLPINPTLAIVVVIWSALETGYLLPSASISASLIYGCDMNTSKSSMLQGVRVMIMWAIVLAVALIPLGQFIFK